MAGTETGGDDPGGGDGFAPPPRRQAAAATACVALAMFLGALSQTVVATTMPLIVADLGGFDRYAWAATSYMVAAVLAYPIVGRLSDIHGRRVYLLLGLAVFSGGSILLGFAETMAQVAAFRAVQGIGGGAAMTCCYVAAADLFRPRDRGRFHGMLGAVYGVSFLVGPAMGGWLADALSWRWAFLAVGLAALPALALTARAYPGPVAPPENRDLDPAGMALLALAVPSLLVALSSGGVLYEWGSPFVIGMSLFAAAALAGLAVVEARTGSPVVPLSLYADPAVGAAAAIAFLAGVGLYGSVLFLPLFFQVALGVSAAQSGVLLVPMLLGMVAGGVAAGQVLSRTSASCPMAATASAGLAAAGLFLLSTMDAATGMAQSQAFVAVAGLGLGGLVATLSVGVQNHAPFAVVGAATAALQFQRSLGGATGMAALGAVLAARFSAILGETAPEAARAALGAARFEDLRNDPRALVDPGAADGLRAELAAAGLDGAAAAELPVALRLALLEALGEVFAVAFVAAILALALAPFFRPAPPPDDAATGDGARRR